MKPTIVTITGPSASGKTFLFEELQRRGYQRFVSTTTRSMREGEVDGEDYYFINGVRSQEIEADGGFAELVTYNGNRYGITIDEVNAKLALQRPIITILTPDGVQIYRKLAKLAKAYIISAYVDTPVDVRLERISNRMIQQLNNPKVDKASFIREHVRRLALEFEAEGKWRDEIHYDLIIPGTDVTTCFEMINAALKAIQ